MDTVARWLKRQHPTAVLCWAWRERSRENKKGNRAVSVHRYDEKEWRERGDTCSWWFQI